MLFINKISQQGSQRTQTIDLSCFQSFRAILRRILKITVWIAGGPYRGFRVPRFSASESQCELVSPFG